MGKGFAENVKKYKEAEGMIQNNPVLEKKGSALTIGNNKKKHIKQFSIEAEIDDMQKLDSALLALINRDNILYRKKDIHIAMVKNFLDLVENNIDKVKIEKC
jgi:hypothetical protein